jgi:hypothetical protein
LPAAPSLFDVPPEPVSLPALPSSREMLRERPAHAAIASVVAPSTGTHHRLNIAKA